MNIEATVRAMRFHATVRARRVVGEDVWRVVRQLSPFPRHRLARLCRRVTGGAVAEGPLRGMAYLDDAVAGGYIPKLLGTYERELRPVLTAVAGLDVERLVNIGAADGYYAVGLARLMPKTRVVAFEMEPRGQAAIQTLAERNGLQHRVKVCGYCGLDELGDVLKEPATTLIVCDVEGFEDVLLDPLRLPQLRAAWMVVELHDGKNPGVSHRLRDRFESTHSIETIWQEKRRPSDFPISTAYTRRLAPRHLEAAVDEGRPVRSELTRMSWYWMVPKRSPEDSCSRP